MSTSPLVAAVQTAKSLDQKGRRSDHLLHLTMPNSDWAGTPLVVHDLDAIEGVSEDFTFTVGVFTTAILDTASALGKSVTVSMEQEDGSLRQFNGSVGKFSLVKFEAGVAFYTMVLRPWFYFLSMRENCYVFNGKTVRQQTEEIFAGWPNASFEMRIFGADPPLFSNQFNESDHNFLCRAWQSLGWVYWFEHSDKGHKMIISDQLNSALPIAGPTAKVTFQRQGVSLADETIAKWSATQNTVTSQFTDAHFDFKKTGAQENQTSSSQSQGAAPSIESYHFSGTQHDFDGTAAARVDAKTASSDGDAITFEGESNIRTMQAGHTFGFNSQFAPAGGAADGYFITRARHQAANNDLVSTGKEGNYGNTFGAIRCGSAWQQPAFSNCDQHRAFGVQTATVYGPPGEEIHTDEYGRIKIIYPWDREKRPSDWVRVAMAAASGQFGAIFIPRVGDEVLVMFLNGNPDTPIVIGSVFNGANKPNWPLPANKAQSGILTRSTPKGNSKTANVLRFDDQKGKEEIWIRAERNQRNEVENDEDNWVGNDRQTMIDHDDTVQIQNDSTKIVNHNENIIIDNNRTESVGQNEDVQIGGDRSAKIGGSKSERVDGGKSEHIGGGKSEHVGGSKTETIISAKMLTIGGLSQTTVGGAMNTTVGVSQSEQVGLMKNVLVGQKFGNQAGDQYSLEVGKSGMTFHADGRVELYATEIIIHGSKKVEIHGDEVHVNPDA